MASPRPRLHRALVLPATGLLALSLVACSGGDDGDQGDGESASPSASTGADDDESTTTSPVLPDAPPIQRGRGAVADISLEDCPTDAGEQSATGMVDNPRDRPTDYLITISWVNDTSDVLGRGYAVVQDLEGGESADWEATGEVAEGATDCTTNVQRGRVGG